LEHWPAVADAGEVFELLAAGVVVVFRAFRLFWSLSMVRRRVDSTWRSFLDIIVEVSREVVEMQAVTA
jgi:hypothetical protein